MVFVSDRSDKVFPVEISMKSENEKKFPLSTDETVVRPGGLNAFQTLANLIKSMIGAGVLSLPLAFKQSGLWCAFILMLIFGFITYYTYKKLVRCSQYLVKKYNYTSLDYGTMMEESFKTSFPSIRKYAVPARYLVNFSIMLMQSGICSVYCVFVKRHLQEILNHLLPGNGIPGWAYSLVVLISFCLLNMVRNLRTVSYVSMTGNILITISLVIIFQELVRAEHHIATLPVYEGVNGVILAAGSLIYAFEGQAMILPLENKMKYPAKMMGPTGVLSIGSIIVTFVYLMSGFFGYITYGKAVEGSITLNLPDITLFFWLKVLLTAVVYTTFLIQQFVMVDMLMPWLKEKCEKGFLNKNEWLAETLLRLGLVLLAFALAVCVPDLDNIIPLVGVTAGMLLALILPAIADTTTFLPGWLERKEYFTMAYNMFWNTVLFVAGLFFLVTGLIENIENIVAMKH